MQNLTLNCLDNMCDHYDHYFPEDKEQRDLNWKRQLEALKPIKPSVQQVMEEIAYLKGRIKTLEQSTSFTEYGKY